jgi:hypothetical protein
MLKSTALGLDPGSSPAQNAGLKRLDSRFRGNDWCAYLMTGTESLDTYGV